MREYEEIARAFGLALIREKDEKSFDYLSGLVKGLKERRAPDSVVTFYSRLKDMREEGCLDEDILKESGLLEPRIMGQEVLDSWGYPETIDTSVLFKEMDELKVKSGLSTEEILFYLFTNFAHALHIKMVE